MNTHTPVDRSAATDLGQAAAATRWRDVPDAVKTRVRELFLDTVAIIAAGSEHEDMRRLAAQIAAGPGHATLIGERRGAALRDALLLNAATTTVLQRQDGYAHAKGHPASQLAPLLLAIAEDRGNTAEQMLGAFVTGYEVAARVGKALGGVPSWLHDSGNWPLIGLVAGAADLLSNGDAQIVAAAIDGGASLGLAFDRFTTVGGATVHHLYPAMATLDALTAAQGAVAGLTSLTGSLERFYGPHFGANFQAGALTEGIGPQGWTSFEILNGYFKLHPSCAHLHGVNDAVEQLIAEEALTPDNFTSIDVDVFREAMEIDAHAPHNDLAARFSARATVAAAIRNRVLDDVGLTELTSLAPLMARINVKHDPDFDRYAPAGRPGRVTVQFTDGRRAVREVIYPRGTPQVPPTPAERQGKAHHLLERHYGGAAADQIVVVCGELGGKADVKALSDALRRAPGK